MDERADGDVDIGEASDEEGGAAKDLGADVSCGPSTWKKVVSMGDDARGDRAKFGMEMKKMTVNSHTKRSDFWKELLPVDHVVYKLRDGRRRRRVGCRLE